MILDRNSAVLVGDKSLHLSRMHWLPAELEILTASVHLSDNVQCATAFGLLRGQRDLAADMSLPNSQTEAKASPGVCTREDACSRLHISCQRGAVPPPPLAFSFMEEADTDSHSLEYL